MTSHNSRLSLDEVLDHFFLTADKPTPNLVLSACEAYPEYRTEIVEYVVLLAAYDASQNSESELQSDATEAEVARVQSFVLNRLYELDAKGVNEADITRAQSVLLGLSGGKKLRETAKAAGLGQYTDLLTKVLSKRISNVPSIIIEGLARHLEIHRDALERILGSQLTGELSYKSADKPIASSLETWEHAVNSLAATEEEKRRLLGLQRSED